MCNDITELEKNKIYTIVEILKSPLLNSTCGKKSKVENETIKLRGRFSIFHFNQDANQMILFDGQNENKSFEVRLSDEVLQAIIKGVKEIDNKEIVITGTIMGYDQRKNFNCKRGYYLEVSEEFKL